MGRGSVTQDLVRDNLEDLGFDQYDQRQVSGDKRPPPLYPPISMQVPTAISDNDVFCIQKMREITLRY